IYYRYEEGDDYEIRPAGLVCAPGHGDGTFGAPATLAPSLAGVDADSLMLGDVDGDGATDACGRDATGILCATAASHFVAQRWTAAFANPETASSPSLAAVDADICGLVSSGFVCAAPGQPVSVRSAWPAAGSTLWPADLDSDQRADWCA